MYRHYCVYLIIAQLFLAIVAPVAVASDCGDIADKMRHGDVRWDEAAIYVQGTAAPNLSHKNLTMIKRGASRAARLDAYRKATAVLGGVTLTATTSVSDVPGVTSRISGYLRGAELCDSKFYADGGVDLVLKIPMQSVYANLSAERAEKAGRLNSAPSEYSGLIVDARGLPFVPALVPTITLNSGETLLDHRTLATRLPVRYLYADDSKVISQIAGSKPLRSAVVTLGASSPSELVLEANASGKLRTGPAFVGKGNTVVLMRAPQPIDCKSIAASVAETRVDWVNRLVLTRGHGQVDFSTENEQAVQMRLMERAAEVDAERRLSSESVSLLTNGQHKDEQGVLVNAVRCGANFFKDGKAEVVLAVPLDQIITPIAWQEPQSQSDVTAEHARYSGIIVDASHIEGFIPTLAPKIVNPQGETIYSSESVSARYGRTRGGVGYQADLLSARQSERIGEAPLVVSAVNTDPGNPQILQLQGEDADRVHQFFSGTDVFSRAAVIIVLPSTSREPQL